MAGGAEALPRRHPPAGPRGRHGHQGPGPEEDHPEGGGLRAPHVLAPPAQRPQPGVRVRSLREESAGEKRKYLRPWGEGSGAQKPDKGQVIIQIKKSTDGGF